MPNSPHPQVSEWDKYCNEQISEVDGLTLVGHSLGCIEALRFIQQHRVSNVNLILVSGFDEKSYALPELDEFADCPLNYAKILPKINQAVVISAFDDDIVPFPYSQTLARHINCKSILMPMGKHFIDRDNITKLPIVYEELNRLLN